MTARAAKTPEEVRAALKGWAIKRAQLQDENGGKMPAREEALGQLLEENEKFICGAIVEMVLKHPIMFTKPLGEISPEFKEFCGGKGVSRASLDVLRRWFSSRFGDRIRVEGDRWDLHLDFV